MLDKWMLYSLHCLIFWMREMQQQKLLLSFLLNIAQCMAHYDMLGYLLIEFKSNKVKGNCLSFMWQMLR